MKRIDHPRVCACAICFAIIFTANLSGLFVGGRIRLSMWPTVDQLIEFTLDQADSSARVDLLQERVLLGAVLCDPNAIEYTWYSLLPADFFDVLHGLIWLACLRLRRRHRCEVAAVRLEVARTPGAVERVEAIEREFIRDDAHRTVLDRCVSDIKRASAQRAAARQNRKVA